MWRFTFILAFFLIAAQVHAADVSFARSLKLGMSGEDVRTLQVFLNQSADTRIATAGPGSPGQESTYFGALTARAVSKFQEKYRSEILTPNNLYSGTGFVGPSTLAVLQKLKNSAQKPAETAAPPFPPTNPVTTPLYPPVSKPQGTINPNVSRLAATFSVLDSVGKRQGYSDDELSRIKTLITKDILATSTDLRSAFVARVVKDYSLPKPLTLETQLFDLAVAFGDLFVPESALAATNPCTYGQAEMQQFCYRRLSICALLPKSTRSVGGNCVEFADFLGDHEFPGTEATAAEAARTIEGATAALASGALPFGGALAGSPIWCLCTGSWWVPITPLPPTFPTALTYYPGSQAYMSYNIPTAIWMLGLYEPGPQCLIYDGDSCIPLPVEGLILPYVGSSL